MHYFTKKGYGRIYTDKEENIEKIKNIHIFCFDARNQEYPTNHLKD